MGSMLEAFHATSLSKQKLLSCTPPLMYRSLSVLPALYNITSVSKCHSPSLFIHPISFIVFISPCFFSFALYSANPMPYKTISLIHLGDPSSDVTDISTSLIIRTTSAYFCCEVNFPSPTRNPILGRNYILT